MFTIGESQAISHANDTEHQAQQVAANLCGEDFPPKLFWSENADFKFSVSNEGKDFNEKPQSRGAERTSLSTTKATPTTRDRNRGTLFSFLSVLLITIGQIYTDFYKSQTMQYPRSVRIRAVMIILTSQMLTLFHG